MGSGRDRFISFFIFIFSIFDTRFTTVDTLANLSKSSKQHLNATNLHNNKRHACSVYAKEYAIDKHTHTHTRTHTHIGRYGEYTGSKRTMTMLCYSIILLLSFFYHYFSVRL
ncbi:hypothetical protein V8C42DRAFT_272364 [Trichoderma barbatum]